MFAHRNILSASIVDLERIEQIVRSRFSVPNDQIVLVSQDQTRLPGGPALMTTVLFWMDIEDRHKLRVFKAAADVTALDLPPAWLRSALLDDVLMDCC